MSETDYLPPAYRMIDHMDDVEAFVTLCTLRWGNSWQIHAARHFGTYSSMISRKIGKVQPVSPITEKEFYSLRDEIVRRINEMNDVLRVFDSFVVKKRERDHNAKAEKIAAKEEKKTEKEEKKKVRNYFADTRNLHNAIAKHIGPSFKRVIFTRREIELMLILGDNANRNSTVSNLDDLLKGMVDMLYLDARTDEEQGVTFYAIRDADPKKIEAHPLRTLSIRMLYETWFAKFFYSNDDMMVSRLKEKGFTDARVPRWIEKAYRYIEESQLSNPRWAKLWHEAPNSIECRKIVETAMNQFRAEDERRQQMSLD